MMGIIDWLFGTPYERDRDQLLSLFRGAHPSSLALICLMSLKKQYLLPLQDPQRLDTFGIIADFCIDGYLSGATDSKDAIFHLKLAAKSLLPEGLSEDFQPKKNKRGRAAEQFRRVAEFAANSELGSALNAVNDIAKTFAAPKLERV